MFIYPGSLSLQFLHQSLLLQPNDPITINEIACIYYNQQDYKQAIHYFNQALNIINNNYSVDY